MTGGMTICVINCGRLLYMNVPHTYGDFTRGFIFFFAFEIKTYTIIPREARLLW